MLKKILVPVDGSENSFRALDYAMCLGGSFGAEIIVSHVSVPYDISKLLETRMLKAGQNDADSAKEKELEARTKAFAGALATAKRKTEEAGYANVIFREVVDLDPAERIAEQAESLGVDMIILGNRGLGTLASLLIGGVSTKLLGLAVCPVLIVK